MKKRFNIFELEKYELPLYKPCQYKVYYGGRDGTKSTIFAKALLRLSFEKKCTIVCCREYFGDLELSVFKNFKEIIDEVDEYKPFFKILSTHIVNIKSKSEIHFKGLRDINSNSIKSVQGIDYIWIEEGAYITNYTWTDLDPTIRKSGSEIWITMNPKHETDFMYNEFICNGKEKYGDRLILQKLSWRNNKYLSEESYFKIKQMQANDFDKYVHVYEGECLRNSDESVFKKEFFIIEDFEEPQGIHPYFGLDFGWTDASAGIRCYIKNQNLYITHEFKKSHVSVDILGEEISKVLKDYEKNGKYTITCDSSSPDLIDLLNRMGYPAKAAFKGKGSIEAGITYIKTFNKCYVNPRCTEFIKEVYNLKYEKDKYSGQIKDKIIDKNNHLVDCWRYALEDCFKNRFTVQFEYKNVLSNSVWV